MLHAGLSFAQAPQQILLFNSGDDGYPRYRVPAVIVAPNNGVLAFCEGRKDGGGFTGNIDLVMKRSTDGGKTWGRSSPSPIAAAIFPRNGHFPG